MTPPSRFGAWRLACLVLLVLLVRSSAAEGGVGSATLYRGSAVLGVVPAMEGADAAAVSLSDVGSLLGFASSVSGEELHLVRGNVRIRVVLNAVAAWYNLYLTPLYGAPFEKEGRWWLDVPSVQALFQRFAGTDAANRLRFDLSVQAAAPVTQTVQESVPAPPKEAGPKLETLFPSSGKSPKNQPPRGTALGIRWSTSRERVRAVIDCADGAAAPQIRLAAGRVEALFAEAGENFEGLPSPYENVSVELRREAQGALLAFSSKSPRVEKLVLDNPRRIVLDFFFNSSAEIREVAPPATPTPPSGPAGKPPVRKGRLLVVLDPGHGGKDPGAVANGVKEKDVNLAIGLEMEKVLLSKGFDVRMTRKTDVYLKLQERTDIANKTNADMFVSIHANALPPGKNSSGFEIYLMALPTDKDALALAKIENREYVEGKTGGQAVDRRTELLLKILGDMQQNNKINESTVAAEALFQAGNSQGLPMKRVAQAPFFVLRGAGMPAVLLETGYLTNAKEAKLLAHPGYQRRIAEAMTAGIVHYLK